MPVAGDSRLREEARVVALEARSARETSSASRSRSSAEEQPRADERDRQVAPHAVWPRAGRGGGSGARSAPAPSRRTTPASTSASGGRALRRLEAGGDAALDEEAVPVRERLAADLVREVGAVLVERVERDDPHRDLRLPQPRSASASGSASLSAVSRSLISRIEPAPPSRWIISRARSIADGDPRAAAKAAGPRVGRVERPAGAVVDLPRHRRQVANTG